MSEEWILDGWSFIKKKVNSDCKAIGANFPHATKDKKYILENEKWWTAGFWPGILWKVYEDTNEDELKYIANRCEEKMNHLLNDTEIIDHDLGFMWVLSSVANYKITGSKESRRRALLAANLLAARFNIAGNYIRAWNPWLEKEDNRGVAIIDCTMNLSLLYWAAEESKDPRFKHIAKKHAETVLKDFIREDGSVHHIVRYDSENGEVVSKEGGQGFAGNSAWSRGAAWAIYGLAISYKYTNDIKFLNAAKKVAHFFMANMVEVDCPVWDFRVPKDDNKYGYLDSSAGAIAACGMLLLSKFVPDYEKDLYYKEGSNILRKLYYSCGTYDDENEEGILRHGTGNCPQNRNIDVSLIYGDYFFVEGISILKGNENIYW